MVALADDWRLTEKEAFQFLSPARVLSNWRSIFGDDVPDATHDEMLAAIFDYAKLDDDLSDLSDVFRG